MCSSATAGLLVWVWLDTGGWSFIGRAVANRPFATVKLRIGPTATAPPQRRPDHGALCSSRAAQPS